MNKHYVVFYGIEFKYIHIFIPLTIDEVTKMQLVYMFSVIICSMVIDSVTVGTLFIFYALWFSIHSKD